MLRRLACLGLIAAALARASPDGECSTGGQVLFLPDTHLGLTRSPVFRDHVLWWLLEQPREH